MPIVAYEDVLGHSLGMWEAKLGERRHAVRRGVLSQLVVYVTLLEVVVDSLLVHEIYWGEGLVLGLLEEARKEYGQRVALLLGLGD